MKIKFINDKRKFDPQENTWYLLPNIWNDYGFVDTFVLYFEDFFLGNIKVFYSGPIKNVNLYSEIQKRLGKEKLYFIPSDILVYSNLGSLMSSLNKDVEWYKKSLHDNNKFVDILYFNEEFKDIRKNVDKDLLNESILRQDYTQHLRASLNLIKLRSIYEDKSKFNIADFLNPDLFGKNVGPIMFSESNLNIFENAISDLMDFDRVEYYKTIGNYLGSHYEKINSIIIEHMEKWFNNENDNDLKACLGNVINQNIRRLMHQIKQIKDDLSVNAKQIPKNSLGQYTSINSLKFLMTRVPENKPCLRLTNSNQMNDPLEGKILQNYLIDDDISKKLKSMQSDNDELDYVKSNSFVSSATATIDSLPMWKQYGDDTTGLCLVYSNKYLNKLLDENKTNVKLYRIAYLDGANLLEVAHFKEDDETVKSISDNVLDALKQIKSIVKDLERDNNIKFYKIGMIIINSIAYLFKSWDYAYENEFRILMNINKLKERDVEVSIVDNKYMLHIYTVDKNENRIPVEYSKVILGPECEDIDFIAPYVKLCNENVHIEKSKIHFR
ncbi:MAG: DUF2971 domain-containing protein [Turicibacter bilis]